MTRTKQKERDREIFQSPKTKAGIQIGKLNEDLGTYAEIWDRR